MQEQICFLLNEYYSDFPAPECGAPTHVTLFLPVVSSHVKPMVLISGSGLSLLTVAVVWRKWVKLN